MTFGDMSKEVGITQAIAPVGLTNLPNFEQDSSPLDEPALYEIMQKYRIRPRKSPSQLPGHGAGGHIRDAYYAMEPDKMMDTYSLTLLSDMVCHTGGGLQWGRTPGSTTVSKQHQ